MNSNRKTEAQRTILLSAGKLIADRGYANVSMRDIAKEANVSLGLLTYYFITKDNLFTALAASLVGSIFDDVKGDLNSDGDPKDKMNRIAHAFERVLRNDTLRMKILVEFMTQSLWNKSFRKQVAKLYDEVARILREDILKEDVLKNNELLRKYSPELLSKVILGALFGTQFELILFDNMSEKELDDIFSVGTDIINLVANHSTKEENNNEQ
ncbi:MAG: TetR/AcrR family transcriptional regulator [Clostridiales bacterium]|nr:TetR/AcrR family transcriptional regulator [Clostridiales bacterium]